MLLLNHFYVFDIFTFLLRWGRSRIWRADSKSLIFIVLYNYDDLICYFTILFFKHLYRHFATLLRNYRESIFNSAAASSIVIAVKTCNIKGKSSFGQLATASSYPSLRHVSF